MRRTGKKQYLCTIKIALSVACTPTLWKRWIWNICTVTSRTHIFLDREYDDTNERGKFNKRALHSWTIMWIGNTEICSRSKPNSINEQHQVPFNEIHYFLSRNINIDKWFGHSKKSTVSSSQVYFIIYVRPIIAMLNIRNQIPSTII